MFCGSSINIKEKEMTPIKEKLETITTIYGSFSAFYRDWKIPQQTAQSWTEKGRKATSVVHALLDAVIIVERQAKVISQLQQKIAELEKKIT